MLATEYAEYYNIEGQREGESDHAFKGRVAGKLRDMGKIIEAHEAQHDERYENSEKVMTGVIGAMAQTLQGVDYGSSGERQIGDDIAAGTIAQDLESDLTPEMALLMVQLFG